MDSKDLSEIVAKEDIALRRVVNRMIKKQQRAKLSRKRISKFVS